jgi:hypothetical protein
MEIVAAFVPEGPLETCDACQTPAEGLTTHVGDRLCDRCKALFLAAEILFEEQISEESEVIPTMASAWYRGRADSAIEESWALEYAKGLAQFYRGLGLVGVVAGLPILRIEPTVVWPVRYDATEWPRMDEGGAELLENWLGVNPHARLVVVDILKRVRPLANSARNRSVYDADYEALQSLQSLASEQAVAILVVHHTRKLAAV